MLESFILIFSLSLWMDHLGFYSISTILQSFPENGRMEDYRDEIIRILTQARFDPETSGHESGH